MSDKILFFRPDHIGDLLLTTPAICSMKKSFPENELVVMANPSAKDILLNNPYVDRIEPCDFVLIKGLGRKVISSTLSNLVKTRKDKYDSVFNFRVSAVAALFVFLSGGEKIYGFDIKKSRWAHSEIVTYEPNTHVVDNYLSLVESYGCRREYNNGLELFLDDNERKKFREKFDIREDYIVLAPGAGELSKMWDNDRWSQLADWIAENLNYSLFFSGGEHEKSLIAGIMGAMESNTENIYNTAGKVNLREFCALVEGAQFVISVDSGSVHIAVATKTPVIGLYGPHNPAEWGPYPNGLPNKIVFKKNFDCQFCKKYDCRTRYCMKDISVVDVIEKIRELLKDLGKRKENETS